MSKHVTKRFTEWSEGKLTPTEQAKIEGHLLSCNDCKKYYDKMSIILDVPVVSAIPQLQPNPYLPTKIEALVREKQQLRSENKVWKNVRVAVFTCVAAVAISGGVYLGKGLAESDTEITTTEEFSYSQIWESGISENWDVLLESEDSQ